MATAMAQEAEKNGTFSPEADNLARETLAAVYLGTYIVLLIPRL